MFQINTLSIAQLEALTDALLDFEAIAQLEEWLSSTLEGDRLSGS